MEKVFVPYTKAMVKSLKNDEVFIPDEELQHIYLDMLGVAGRTNLKKKGGEILEMKVTDYIVEFLQRKGFMISLDTREP